MTNPYSQEDIESTYQSLRFDAAMCQQEIARTCAMLTRYETRSVLLRRAQRLKEMGVNLNKHQKTVLDDGPMISYEEKCNHLRERLSELRAEHEGILRTIVGLEQNYDLCGVPAALLPESSSYSKRLKANILRHANIDGYKIGAIKRSGDLVEPNPNRYVPESATIFIENEHVRIYASPFWDLEDAERDNSKYLQIDVYVKNKRQYLSTIVDVEWSYNLDLDREKWVTICKSVIATIFIREVDPMEER